jgi:hypothetical protein
MPKPGTKKMTIFLVGLLTAVTLATNPTGAARANVMSATPRFAPSQIALRVRNVTQHSSANAHGELLLAQGPSRDDTSAALPDAGAAEDDPQRAQSEATDRSILMAALALAGIAGCVIFKLGSLRYTRRTRLRKRRGAIWAAADRARRTSKSYAGSDDRPRQPELVRDLDQAAQRRASKRKPMPRQARRSPI